MSLRRRVPEIADALMALAMIACLYWWALRGNFWKDFKFEAEPAVSRLLAGDLRGFLGMLPVYGGSLVIRAPVTALSGNVTDAYRSGALECAIPLVGLAWTLARRLRRTGEAAWTRGLVIALAIANPVAIRAVQIGHPEELLATGLAVVGVLLAARGRSLIAGLAIGCAIASKQWAVIALPIAIAVVPSRRAVLAAATAAGSALLIAPIAAVSAAGVIASNRAAATATTFFNPNSIWWLLGGSYQRPLGGSRSHVFVAAPTPFVAHWSHPLILIAASGLGLVFWRRRPRLSADDALLVLAAAGLLRCALDPWNIIYYHLPFLVALLAWEVRARPGAPILSLAATGLVWISFEVVGPAASPSTSTAVYLAWALPVLAAVIARGLRLLPRTDVRSPYAPRRTGRYFREARAEVPMAKHQ